MFTEHVILEKHCGSLKVMCLMLLSAWPGHLITSVTPLKDVLKNVQRSEISPITEIVKPIGNTTPQGVPLEKKNHLF